MSNSMIYFVIWFTIYIGREGVWTVGQFSFLYFSLLAWEGVVSKEKVPNSLFMLLFFLQASLSELGPRKRLFLRPNGP